MYYFFFKADSQSGQVEPPSTPVPVEPATLDVLEPTPKAIEKSSPSPTTKPRLAKPSVETATKEKPFVNSLGMKFVPVSITGRPTDGQRVLFSIWETRVQDYAAFVKDNPGVDSEWKDVEYRGEKQEPTHPVVNVSWEDANAFCAWLTRKEHDAGRLDSQHEYRLPTDHEWSCAIGIGAKEPADVSPAENEERFKVWDFPWDPSGQQRTPPPGAGNFAGAETRKFGWRTIDGYQDKYAFTAPVNSFNENSLGVFNLSGNVWEWCEDWYDNEEKNRVLRGGSWNLVSPVFLRSSRRINNAPDTRSNDYGFRCVVGAVGRSSARRWHLPHFQDQPDVARLPAARPEPRSHLTARTAPRSNPDNERAANSAAGSCPLGSGKRRGGPAQESHGGSLLPFDARLSSISVSRWLSASRKSLPCRSAIALRSDPCGAVWGESMHGSAQPRSGHSGIVRRFDALRKRLEGFRAKRFGVLRVPAPLSSRPEEISHLCHAIPQLPGRKDRFPVLLHADDGPAALWS